MSALMKKTCILLILTILLCIVPFFIPHGGNYEGADGQAQALIETIQPDYQPWFKSFYTPPSHEIESLLFALQAILGAFAIGYILGMHHKPKDKQKKL